MNAFAEFFGPIASGVSPALIAPSAFAAMQAVVRRLPASLADNTFGFECRMGDDLPYADLSVHANPSSGRESLAGLDPTTALAASLTTDPIWQRVQAFATDWAEPSSPLHHAVDALWMEFDLDGAAPENPRPSVFLGLSAYDEGDSAAGRAKADGYRATAETSTRLLAGHTLSPRTRGSLAGCFTALQRFEYVYQVGLMLARGVEGIRLCVRLGSTERTREYLVQVGWPGRERDLRGILGWPA